MKINLQQNRRITQWVPWAVGLALLTLIIELVHDLDVSLIMNFFSFSVVLLWTVITLLSRLLMGEVFVQPIRALGYSISRIAAFWLGWMRSFCNQFIPFSGIALLAGYCKRHCGLDWGQIAALSSPMFLVDLAITGTFATAAIIINHNNIGQYVVPMAMVSIVVTGLTVLMIIKVPSGFSFMPIRIRNRLVSMEQTLQIFASQRRLLWSLALCYTGVVLLRCLRLWLLFVMGTNLSLSIHEIILLAAISEFGFLIPLIPGGIGFREGAMISAAWMLGLSIETVALVALVDRVFIVLVVALMAAPAYLSLRRDGQSL